MANLEIVNMDEKLDTPITIWIMKSWVTLSIVILLFGNGCIMGGNGATFPFANYASPFPSAFYNVACNLPLWYDWLSMNGFLI